MMNTTTYSLANESRQNLLAMYSDIHKDALGFRPRDWQEVTLKPTAELIEDIEYYSKVADEEIERERQNEADAKLRWDTHIQGIMRDNSVDRATALRWDMDAMGATGDVGYYCFLWNMSYTLEPEIKYQLKACG